MLRTWQAIEKIGNGIFRVPANCRENQKFEKALTRLAKQIGTTATTFRIIVEGVAGPFRTGVLQNIYRIAREGLVNAFRHSHATEIEVELHFSARYFVILIRDNGCGMDSESVSGQSSCHGGLLGMYEQANRIGAQLRVMSRVAVGTEIQFSLPGQIAFEPRDCGVQSNILSMPYRAKETKEPTLMPYSSCGLFG